MPGAKRTYSTEKSGIENEKESSVKTEITIADDVKNTELMSVSEGKTAVNNNIDVMNYALSQDATKNASNATKTIPSVSENNIETNNAINSHTASKSQLKSPNGVSSSSSRLFDVYEPQRSPTPTRTKL